MSKLCCLNEWELLKSPRVSVEILLCRGVSCGIHLREGKEFRCHLCACSLKWFWRSYVCTKKLEKLDIWEWKLVVFQAILDLKVLNPLINKPWFRLECLGLILKVILWGTCSCWLALKIIICTFQSCSAISSAWGLNGANVISTRSILYLDYPHSQTFKKYLHLTGNMKNKITK